MMLSTLLRFAPKDEALRAEAKFGLDWLLRMFPKVDGQRTLIYQVGIGDGNCSGTDATTSRGRPCYVGDHDVWRLPEADDLLNITRDDRDDKQCRACRDTSYWFLYSISADVTKELEPKYRAE